MDRIEKALNKSQGTKIRSTNIDIDLSFDKQQHLHPLEQISYTVTRKIEVSPQVLSNNRIIAANRSDPRAIAFRMLRTRVLQRMREKNLKTLAITGPLAGVGKSLVAANLALSISQEVNQTVLLIDLDLRKPKLHEYFGFLPEQGILDVLENDVELCDVMVNPSFERFVLVPGRGSSNNSSELLSSPKMFEILNDVREKYDSRIIIFDLPPLLNIEDALVFLPNIDAALLVVENGRNTKSDVQKSLRLLEGINLLGTVLNKSDEKLLGYS